MFWKPWILWKGWASGAALCLAVWLGTSLGCAYFNTLYNARKSFREAQEMPRAKEGTLSGQAEEKYADSIEKCEALIAAYPESKYVDDAVALIARSLYERGEYDDAIARFEQLDTLSTDEDLKRAGRFYKAKAHVGKGSLESAVPILQQMIDQNPDEATDETYFLLGTSLVKLRREEDALKYLEMLAKRYPQSPYRVKADLEAAEAYSERKEYEKSVSVYSRLDGTRLAESERIRYLTGLGKVYAEQGEYRKAIDALSALEPANLDPSIKAGNMLVSARAFAGLDSVDAAIRTYKEIAGTYPRSLFSAEAHYRLGAIYQNVLDSLDVARKEFDLVPQEYAQSEFAGDAIAKSGAITKLQRLKEALAAGSQGDPQMTQFDLAEIEFSQFRNYTKAIEGYQKLLTDFPDGDYAPKAAYAIAYIYDAQLQDSVRAKAAYEHVVARYPASQQARHAREALGLPPLPESPALADSLQRRAAPDTSRAGSVPDSLRSPAPADSSKAQKP